MKKKKKYEKRKQKKKNWIGPRKKKKKNKFFSCILRMFSSMDPPISSHCDCENIRITGNHFTRLYKTGFSETLQQIVARNSEPLVQIRSNGVTVDQPSKIVCTKSAENSCTIRCMKCGCDCNVYISKGNAFAQIKKKNPNADEEAGEMGMFQGSSGANSIPRQMRSLIAFNDSLEDYDHKFTENLSDDDLLLAPTTPLGDSDDNDDFDIMFSNTTAPIVGSYTESPMTVSFFWSISSLNKYVYHNPNQITKSNQNGFKSFFFFFLSYFFLSIFCWNKKCSYRPLKCINTI